MAGELFADPQKAAAATADVQSSTGKIVGVRLIPYKDRRSVRVVFDLEPGSESYAELRLTLNLDNQAVSETWPYRCTACRSSRPKPPPATSHRPLLPHFPLPRPPTSL